MTAQATDRRAALRAEVAIGRAGYLFHRWDAAFEQLCDASTLDDIDLGRWRTLLEYRSAWCELYGSRYHLLVVPEKHVVYEDRLAPGRSISADRPFQRIRAALHPDVQRRVIYPLAELRQARRVEKTYFLTDVLWTEYGAYVAYRALLRGLSADVPMQPIPEPGLQREKGCDYTGDIGTRLDPEPVEEQVLTRPVEPPKWRMVLDSKNIMEGQVRIFETDDRTLPRAVIFRDSNLDAMMPFLLGHFSRAVVVGGARCFLHDLVQSEHPDLVITEIAERCLAVPLPADAPGSIHWTEDLTRVGFSDFTGLPLPSGSGKGSREAAPGRSLPDGVAE